MIRRVSHVKSFAIKHISRLVLTLSICKDVHVANIKIIVWIASIFGIRISLASLSWTLCNNARVYVIVKLRVVGRDVNPWKENCRKCKESAKKFVSKETDARLPSCLIPPYRTTA